MTYFKLPCYNSEAVACNLNLRFEFYLVSAVIEFSMPRANQKWPYILRRHISRHIKGKTKV